MKTFKQGPVFFFLLVILGLLPFLDGGTHVDAQILLVILPLPLFLLGLVSGEFRFGHLSSWVVFFWFAFLVFVGTSLINSASLIHSIPAFFELLGMSLFFVLFLLTATKENLKFVAWLVMIIAFLLSLLSLHYLLPWVEKPTSQMNLVYATFGHNHLANYLILAIPFALAIFLTTKKESLKLIMGALSIFFLLSLLLTFSRGAFIFFPLVIILLLFLVKPKTRVKRLMGYLWIIAPLGLLLLITILSLNPGVRTKLTQPDRWLVRQLHKPDLQSHRLDFWQQGLDGFRNRPLSGFGWGTFELIAMRFQQGSSGWSYAARNFYLQVASEAGIFAFFTFLGFLILSFRSLWQLVRRNRDNPLSIGGLGAILASALHSLVDYDWYFPAVFLTFLFLLASLVAMTLTFQNSVRNRISKSLKWLMIGLSTLVFIFGLTQIAGEYFYWQTDYQKGLLFSPWPTVRVYQAVGEIFNQDFTLGEKVAQRIISLSPEDPSIHYLLAERYFYQGDLEKAAENYRKAIFYYPLGNHYLYQKLGKIYLSLGKEKEKEKLYQFFAQKLEETKAYQREDHPLAKTLYSIAEEYLAQGRSEEEILFWWEKAVAASPDRSFYRVELTDYFSRQDTKTAKIFYSQGLNQLAQGNKEEVISSWKKAVRAAPEWSYFHLELASLYFSLDQLGLAKEVLHDCVEFLHPRLHCQDYLWRLSEDFGFEAPGYWQGEIRAISDE